VRVAGRVTHRDVNTIAALTSALRVAAELVEPTLRAMQQAGAVLTPVLVQLARGAAMVEAFDATPRHRDLPARDDVIEWLDRHVGPEPVLIVDDPLGRPPFDAAARARATAWYVDMRAAAAQRVTEDGLGAWPPDLDRPGAGGRYSHTGGWVENWGQSGG
jgi:hypothetical protein